MKTSKNIWSLVLIFTPMLLMYLSFKLESIKFTKIITGVLSIMLVFVLFQYKKLSKDNENVKKKYDKIAIYIILSMAVLAYLYNR